MLDKIFVNDMRLDDKEIALDYILRYSGHWYTWAGDDPSGYDCSGLACEFLQACGKIDRKSDFSAAGLYNLFKRVKVPYRGCLVFWEDKDKAICHVEIMLNKRLSLGAMGGGSNILTIDDAKRNNAFIKVRNIWTREAPAGFVDPFL